MTDREKFGYRPGNYAHQCYVAAGWGEPNPRYWVDADEVGRRLAVLAGRYEAVGIRDGGRSHDIDFDAEAAPAAA